MKSVRPIAVGSVMPPISALISKKPRSWQGMPIDWSSDAAPVPVFLGKLSAVKAEGCGEVYVFGARYELADALIGGQSLGPGYFVEYFVAEERSPGEWSIHRLLQRQSVTFSEGDEPGDFVAADSVADKKVLCLDGLPKWKGSEAVWPTYGKKPMRFYGQLTLPDTKVARELFTWGMNIYLFSTQRDDSTIFKIVAQETDFQAAAEHYASESDGN
jgi:hypothetical protein